MTEKKSPEQREHEALHSDLRDYGTAVIPGFDAEAEGASLQAWKLLVAEGGIGLMPGYMHHAPNNDLLTTDQRAALHMAADGRRNLEDGHNIGHLLTEAREKREEQEKADRDEAEAAAEKGRKREERRRQREEAQKALEPQEDDEDEEAEDDEEEQQEQQPVAPTTNAGPGQEQQRQPGPDGKVGTADDDTTGTNAPAAPGADGPAQGGEVPGSTTADGSDGAPAPDAGAADVKMTTGTGATTSDPAAASGAMGRDREAVIDAGKKIQDAKDAKTDGAGSVEKAQLQTTTGAKTDDPAAAAGAIGHDADAVRKAGARIEAARTAGASKDVKTDDKGDKK